MTKKASIIAGLSLLLMTIAALFTYGYIHSTFLKAPSDVIYESTGQITVALIGWGIIIILDFIVAWAFHICLKHANKNISIINMLLRIVYTFILMMAVYQILQISLSLQTLSIQEIIAYNESFETIWSFGLILFGVHLFITGYLSIQSTKIPSILGILLILAGLSYVLVHTLKGFSMDVSLIETILSLPMMIGELGFGLWLLIKGRKLL